MAWMVRAVCDRCGRVSDQYRTRAVAVGILKRHGWMKGRHPGEMVCPGCAPAYRKELKDDRRMRLQNNQR